MVIPASERSVTDMTQERICFEPRTEGVRIVDVTASVLDFAGAGTITASGISIRESSNLTLKNLTIDATNAGKSVIGIQAWSIPDLTVTGCNMTGVYIGVHHNNGEYLGPNDSLGTMTVKNCTIRNAIHEGLYIGQSGRRFDESTMPAFAMVRITNNTIRNSGWDCIQFSSNHAAEIIGNTCDGYGANPQYGDPTRQTRGIIVQEQTASAKCALVKSNTIDGTKDGWDGVLVFTTSCGDIRDNLIIRPGNRGVTVFSGGRAIITGNVIDRPVDDCWGGSGDIQASRNECLK